MRSQIADGWIQWSDGAPLVRTDGTLVSPFERNSYVARVDCDDGHSVAIALPADARRHGHEAYITRVAAAAEWMRSVGVLADDLEAIEARAGGGGRSVDGTDPETPQ